MTRKDVLKKAVEIEGTKILLDPSKLRRKMQEIDKNQEYNAIQVELVLNSTRLGNFLQKEKKISCIGKVAYRNLLIKAYEETGLKMSVIESIARDILSATGLNKQEVFFEKVDETQLPSLINTQLEITGDCARGEEAYFCGKLFLAEESRFHFGSSNSKNIQTAFSYFKRAALDGCERAYGILGLFYYYGMGTLPDEELALEYLMMPGGLTEPYYLSEKRKVLQKLVTRITVEKQKKRSIILLSVVAFLFIVLVSTLLEWTDVYMYLWLGVAALNLLFVGSFMIKSQKKGGFYQDVLTFSSVFIWIGFLANICL